MRSKKEIEQELYELRKVVALDNRRGLPALRKEVFPYIAALEWVLEETGK